MSKQSDEIFKESIGLCMPLRMQNPPQRPPASSRQNTNIPHLRNISEAVGRAFHGIMRQRVLAHEMTQIPIALRRGRKDRKANSAIFPPLG